MLRTTPEKVTLIESLLSLSLSLALSLSLSRSLSLSLSLALSLSLYLSLSLSTGMLRTTPETVMLIESLSVAPCADALACFERDSSTLFGIRD